MTKSKNPFTTKHNKPAQTEGGFLSLIKTILEIPQPPFYLGTQDQLLSPKTMTKSRVSTCTVPRSWFTIEALTKAIIQEKEIKHIQIGKYYKLHINWISNFWNCKLFSLEKVFINVLGFKQTTGLALIQCINKRQTMGGMSEDNGSQG